jgi:transposase
VGYKRRTFTKEFKLKLIAELETGRTNAEVAREYRVHPVLLSRWHCQYHQSAGTLNETGITTEQEKIATLERTVGQLTMENLLLKKALRHIEHGREET